MTDLVTWLRAQLDVDEQWARAARSDGSGVFDGTGIVVMHANTGTRSVTLRSDVATHITCWDPVRVLAEVDAKRRLLEEVISYEWGADAEKGDACGRDNLAAGKCKHTDLSSVPALQMLALPYADRLGYRQEWSTELGS